MHLSAQVNQDAEMLLVPQDGTLRVVTELGVLEVAVGEVAPAPLALPRRRLHGRGDRHCSRVLQAGLAQCVRSPE